MAWPAGADSFTEFMDYQIIAEHHAAFVAVAAADLAFYGSGFIGG